MTDPTPPPDDTMAVVPDPSTVLGLAEWTGDRRTAAVARRAVANGHRNLERASRPNVVSVAEAAQEYVGFATEPGARFRSGIRFVDEITRGTAPGEVTTLLAPAYTGKTTILCNVAVHNPLEGLLFFSIEMPVMLVAARLGAILFEERYRDLEDRLVKGDGVLKAQLAEDLGVALPNLGLVGRGGIGASEMERMIDEYEQSFQQAPRAIMIDYLDLMGGGTEGVESVKRKFNELRELGKARELSVIVAHQVTGHVLDTRMGQALRFNDGRYAGAAESDHTVAAFRRINDDEVKADPWLYAHERWTIHFQILKTRSGEAHPEPRELGWNPHTLRITPEYDNEARLLWEPSPTPRARAVHYVATQQSLSEEDE